MPCRAELGWLHTLLQERKTGLRVVSLCFDDSREVAERTLLSLVGTPPIVTALKGLGVAMDGEAPAQAVVNRLRGLGVNVGDAGAREAVLATLRHLGVDFDRRGKGDHKTLDAVYGDRFTLHVVPADQQHLHFEAAGDGGVPQIYVVDQQGVLRFAGYPMHETLEDLITSLLDDPAHQEVASTK